jgi:hypothetical protein
VGLCAPGLLRHRKGACSYVQNELGDLLNKMLLELLNITAMTTLLYETKC